MELLDRISIDLEVCHGKPIIRGMRWTVEMVLDLLGAGMSIEDILTDHPELEYNDILACITFAKSYLSGVNVKSVA